MPVAEAVLAAGAERVRPILMTTIATIAGLAPLAFGIGAGADLQRPARVRASGLAGARVISSRKARAADFVSAAALVSGAWTLR
jgi:HAE1 family hydrophobic/amphiphilic exporter-1